MVMTALIAIGSLVMVGLVLDLGQLRADRRVNKSVTDMAARAGVGRLPFGPWSGVCKARDYLLSNGKGFSSFDTGTETWSNANAQVTTADPCLLVATAEDLAPCVPNNPATWAKLQATAGKGRFTIEIQSGYALPDARFPIDTGLGDTGGPDAGGCDNLAVILTERQAPNFAQAGGGKATNVRVRSVGRLNATQTLDFVAALQLLELHDCNVLQTGGNSTRVIAQPYNAYPGTIQIDSDGTGDCPSPILNAQDTSSDATLKPSVLACSANSTNLDCRRGVGDRPSRVGVYAVNFNKPSSVVASPFPDTYGDTRAIASPRTGRKYTDIRYRTNVDNLDEEVKATLTGNGGKPPGCPSSGNYTSCTGTAGSWEVVNDCRNLGPFTSTAPRIWFNCDLNVTSAMTLSAPGAVVVVTGQLQVSSTLTITDPRKVFVGGKSGSNGIGLDVSGSTSSLQVNMGSASTCNGRTEAGHANRLVVANGSFKAGSGGSAHVCQTFIYLASGYDKVPAQDGAAPCTTTACSTYTGTLSVSSGAAVDLSAANEITGRLPAAEELRTTYPFEDLGLWTEAGGNSNSMAGGAQTMLRGVFFLPNADAFNLAGGGDLPIDLSAQFVCSTLKVTGNATVNLVPNPEDSIPVTIYSVLLVR